MQRRNVHLHVADNDATATIVGVQLSHGTEHDVANSGIADSTSQTPFCDETKTSRARQHTAIDPLQVEEANRAHGWSIAVIALTTSAFAFSFFIQASHHMLLLFRACLSSMFVIAAYISYRCRDPRHYTTRLFRVFGWILATGSFGLTYFLGVMSPTPLIITLGISFFGLGIDRTHAIAIPLYATVGYFVLCTAVIIGLIPDAGLVAVQSIQTSAQLLFVTFVPAIYLITLWMARLSRRTMQDAIERSKRSLIVARQRAAQLAEAQQYLEDALRAGAGAEGRYSGAQAGSYTLGEVIGRGTMGEVYKGTASDNQRVAVKILRSDQMGPANLERFFRESELGRTLRSPHVVHVHEAGQLNDGMPFIAMEHLEGEDLAAKLRRDSRLNLRETVDLVEQIARGLSVAHRAGIIHRDLKPHNLFEVKQPRARGIWKILDFGVSKRTDSEGTLTHTSIVGTPAYMSPEQARGLTVDVRTDLFSLASVTYRTLTGTPAFRGADTPAILFEVVYQQPIQPSAVRSNLSLDVDRVLALGLCKDPKHRFQSALEFAEHFASAASGTLSADFIQQADRIIASRPWGQRLSAKQL